LSTALGQRRWPRRLLSLLLSTAVCTSMLVAVVASPAAAHYPIDLVCAERFKGQKYIQWANDGTEDYAIWVCSQGTHPPYPYYWRLSGISNAKEQLKKIGRGIKAFTKGGIWAGIVQGAVAQFSEGSYDRAHIRFEGSFNLQDWQGGDLNRDMGVHMVLKHYVNGAWSACADTGWKDASSPTFAVSYTSWKLTSSCTGDIQVSTRAHFFQQSTNSWWTSDWITFAATSPT
jgi:hypothetical protein